MTLKRNICSTENINYMRKRSKHCAQCNLKDKVKSVMANSSETNDNIGNKSHPETIVIINCVLNVPFMLVSIIGNTLVLYTIFRIPSLRSPSIILLCSLAVSNLLVGLFVQPVYIANELMKTVRCTR